jgi:hypothetical protein
MVGGSIGSIDSAGGISGGSGMLRLLLVGIFKDFLRIFNNLLRIFSSFLKNFSFAQGLGVDYLEEGFVEQNPS